MSALQQRWLWAGFATSVLSGALLRTLELRASGAPLWPALEVLLDVGFWFCMTFAALLAVSALGVTSVVSAGGGRQATTALLIGLAATLGVAFVAIVATRDWAVFTTSGSGAQVGYISFVADALVGLLEVSGGSLIALATLALLTSKDRPRAQQAEPRQGSATGDDESGS